MIFPAQEIVVTFEILRQNLIFYASSVPKQKYRLHLHTCISEKTWGALIGVGVLIKANTVSEK